MALEVMVGFLGIGQSSRSVSGRVIKLAVPHYLFTPLPSQKREAMDMKSKGLLCP